MDRRPVWSQVAATSHTGLISSSASRAWPVAPQWTAQTEGISAITESSPGQLDSRILMVLCLKI